MRTLSPVTQADAFSALRNAGAGDTVKLGNIAMDSLTGGTAIAPGVTIEGGQFTRINGGWNKVKFLRPTLRPNGIGVNTTAIILHGDDCIVQGLDLDCRDGDLWTARDWLQRATGGVMFYGHGCQLIGGAMYGVRTGFVAQHSSTGARVEGLRIKGISGDAFRPNGNGTRIALCYVTDTWAVDGNHDDMVQSFAIDPATGKPSNSYTDTVDDVQIVGNEFYSCDDPKNEIWSRTAEPGPINPDAVPLISAGQGIWMGDGAPQNWTVDGNLLVLTPWKHGISLGGAIGCRVTNNRVIDGNPRYRGEACAFSCGPGMAIRSSATKRQACRSIRRTTWKSRRPTTPSITWTRQHSTSGPRAAGQSLCLFHRLRLRFLFPRCPLHRPRRSQRQSRRMLLSRNSQRKSPKSRLF